MMLATQSAVVERVLQLLAADDSVDAEIVLVDDVTGIGRGGFGFTSSDDVDVADLHAEICCREDSVVLRDPGEGTGVWLRVVGTDGRLLHAGDQVWLGSQILVIRREDEGWQVRHHGPDGRFRENHGIAPGGILIGRASELALDPLDSGLSRRHAQLVPEGDDLRLYDRGAHNGTYVKLLAEESLEEGDEFRLANSRFRYVTRERPGESMALIDGQADSSSPIASEKTQRPRGLGARLRGMGRRVVAKSSDPDSADPAEYPAHQEEAPVEASGIETDAEPTEKVLLVIDSEEGSVSLEVSAGKTVLEAVQEAGLERGLAVDWECADGGCGVCILAVVEGADRMDPPDPSTGEMKTIQITEQVVPDPTKYRLACLARVRGTVRLRKL